MRIVHVSSFYGPSSHGMRTALAMLGAGYKRAGHEFIVIAPGRRAHQERTEYGTVVSVAARPRVEGSHSLIPVDFAVRRALVDLGPDRLEVSDRLTMRRLGAWAQRRGIPSVLFSHEKPTEWLLGSVATAGEREGATGAGNASSAAVSATGRRGMVSLDAYSAIVCTSAAAVAAFDRVLPGRARLIRLGVDLETFSPLRWSGEVRRTRLDGAGVLLATVGRLSTEKSPQLALDTLAALRERGVDARLLVIGDGPLRARLQRGAAGTPVTFVGEVEDRRRMSALLASADVLLSPGANETFGMSALEALASGTPVVASSASALGEILTGAEGATADGSGASFADAVERVLARRVEDRRTAARERAAEFSADTFVASMLALHESLGAPAR